MTIPFSGVIGGKTPALSLGNIEVNTARVGNLT